MIIPFKDFYQQDFGLNIRQLFSNAAPWATAKGQKSIWMQIIALVLPSLRPENLWILVKFRIVMVSHRLDEDGCSFWNGKVANKIIFLSLSYENSVAWSKEPQCLIDGHFRIGQVLHVFIRDICITMNELVDFFSELSIHLRIF